MYFFRHCSSINVYNFFLCNLKHRHYTIPCYPLIYYKIYKPSHWTISVVRCRGVRVVVGVTACRLLDESVRCGQPRRFEGHEYALSYRPGIVFAHTSCSFTRSIMSECKYRWVSFRQLNGSHLCKNGSSIYICLISWPCVRLIWLKYTVDQISWH